MKDILILTDFSKNAKAAERYALQLAIKIKANLILYNAYPMAPLMPLSENVVWAHDAHLTFELESISNLQARVDELNDELKTIDNIAYKPSINHLGNPGNLASNLDDVLIENNIGLVVMGTKGERFANNILFGSNVLKVINSLNQPVLIIPPNAELKHLKKIAYATDLANPDLFIIEWLNEFVKTLKLEFSIINVCPGMQHPENNLSKSLTERLYKTEFPDLKIESYHGKNVRNGLHEVSQKLKIDLLVLMHKKYGFFDGLFHSSTSLGMVKQTQMPVLVFPEKIRA